MKISRWLFPIGAILVLGGVAMAAELERHSFHETQDSEFRVLSTISLPSLLLGSLLAIVGSVFDRRRLPHEQSRKSGLSCLVCGIASLILFWTFGNVHGWTFAFFFPMLAGFICGAILLV